jgi:hypothetical protein
LSGLAAETEESVRSQVAETRKTVKAVGVTLPALLARVGAVSPDGRQNFDLQWYSQKFMLCRHQPPWRAHSACGANAGEAVV